jgi:hypothetical protein
LINKNRFNVELFVTSAVHPTHLVSGIKVKWNLPPIFSVANKAYSQHTWTNDKRHTWKQWKYGHSSLSVDGKENNNLHNCAIMDNYYVDKVSFL